MEPRDKQREVALSGPSYSKHLCNGCFTAVTGADAGGGAVTVQLMCVDSAGVIYSLFWALLC